MNISRIAAVLLVKHEQKKERAYTTSKFCDLEQRRLEIRFLNLILYNQHMPVPVAARSKAKSAAARRLRLWVRIPPGQLMSLCCECCVLLGKGLCDGLITRPEESKRVCCVVVCDLET